MLKNSLNLVLLSGLLCACILFVYGIFFMQDLSKSWEKGLEKTKKNILVAQTLSSEGPKDTNDIPMLVRVSNYCTEAGIGQDKCSVRSLKPRDKKGYTSNRYVVQLERILMGKALKFYQKLERLPGNVRVLKSSLERVEEKKNRRTNKKSVKYLRLNIEMDEIEFKKS
ncbi:MAG: hypothetical protein COB02_03200 [Candidatus Cloacimonadota bacterium]|nr:MAG: hypothetical protein COB02_03200 [Candidatus Cloacimonadota bacterium]